MDDNSKKKMESHLAVLAEQVVTLLRQEGEDVDASSLAILRGQVSQITNAALSGVTEDQARAQYRLRESRMRVHLDPAKFEVWVSRERTRLDRLIERIRIVQSNEGMPRDTSDADS